MSIVYKNGEKESFEDILNRLQADLEEAPDDEEESSTLIMATILKDGSILTLNDTLITHSITRTEIRRETKHVWIGGVLILYTGRTSHFKDIIGRISDPSGPMQRMQDLNFADYKRYFKQQSEVINGFVRIFLCGYHKGEARIMEFHRDNFRKVDCRNELVAGGHGGPQAVQEYKFASNSKGTFENADNIHIECKLKAEKVLLYAPKAIPTARHFINSARVVARNDDTVGGDAECCHISVSMENKQVQITEWKEKLPDK